MVLGDFNLDWLTCLDEDLAPQSQTARTRPLVEELATRILSQGVSQCVRGVTRSWPGHPDSCLDLIFTNVPEKMSEAKTVLKSSSDHLYIEATRYAKNIKTSPLYTKKRSYKDFNEEQFVKEVRELRWWDLYECQDPNRAAEILTEKINYPGQIFPGESVPDPEKARLVDLQRAEECDDGEGRDAEAGGVQQAARGLGSV